MQWPVARVGELLAAVVDPIGRSSEMLRRRQQALQSEDDVNADGFPQELPDLQQKPKGDKRRHEGREAAQENSTFDSSN